MAEGFQLDLGELAKQISKDIRFPGWTVRAWFESYVRPDFQLGMMITDPVDRVVVTFVGSREEARKAEAAIRGAMAE